MFSLRVRCGVESISSSSRSVRLRFLSILVPLLAGLCAASQAPDPFATAARATVLLFIRSDCPITNRYAPDLKRIADKFAPDGVAFWLVYPDPAETDGSIQKHIAEYQLPGKPLRDPGRTLIRRAHATVAPEAAVFDSGGKLIYHGRIDDRWVEIGKSRPAPTTHDLEDAISAVLAGRPVAHPETRAIGCSLADLE